MEEGVDPLALVFVHESVSDRNHDSDTEGAFCEQFAVHTRVEDHDDPYHSEYERAAQVFLNNDEEEGRAV